MLSVVVRLFGYDGRRLDNFLEHMYCVTRQHTEFEYIIIEQYIDKPVYEFVQDLGSVKYKSVKHHTYCPWWLNNVGAKMASGDKLVFMPTDVVFGDTYFDEIDTLDAECAIGWDDSYWLSELGRSKYILSRNLIDTPALINDKDNYILRKKPIIDGGCCGICDIFNRDFFFEKFGGYNETFINWGAEDNETFTRAEALTDVAIMKYTLFHLRHEGRNYTSRKANIKLWQFAKSNPQCVTDVIIKTGIGRDDRPSPLSIYGGLL